jgi:hypothetical protein
MRRRPRALVGAAAIVAAVAACAANPARAQTGPGGSVYAGGSVFADVKRFSGDPSNKPLDGQAVGGAAQLGTSLGDRWDIEIGIEVPAFTSSIQPHPVVANKATTITLQDRTENRVISVPAIVRFRSAPHGRVQLGYLAGLSIVRLQRNFDTLAPAGTPGGLVPKPHEIVGYAAAPVLGVDARIAINGRLAVVPAVRASVLNVVTQVSGVLVRPHIGLRWTF